MGQKVITISLPEAMLSKVDEAARDAFSTRSEFIRGAMPTEDELFATLRRRQAMRWYINRRGEWRRRGDKDRRI